MGLEVVGCGCHCHGCRLVLAGWCEVTQKPLGCLGALAGCRWALAATTRLRIGWADVAGDGVGIPWLMAAVRLPARSSQAS